MQNINRPRTQLLTIIAQDPGVRVNQGGKERMLRARVEVPAERWALGPWGYRVHVIDYDATSDRLWKPYPYESEGDLMIDPFVKASDRRLLTDPQFHQQNVYAIVMRILAKFEYALGRRIGWSFGGHQIKVAPHAFADANAFYSKEDEALLFGYFTDPGFDGKKRPRAGKGVVFSCLSHDVVAHETTHALVDGLRSRFTDPSSPDQAAFHEGISDVIALLSVFSLREVTQALLGRLQDDEGDELPDFSPKGLRSTALFAMAKQMGSALNQVRGGALRRSTEIEPSDAWQDDPEYLEPHRRGEVLVAMMLNALIHIWSERIAGLKQDARGRYDMGRVVEEGQRAADYLLTMSIRALDYCPPVHLSFRDYLSALLTADREIRPDDSVFRFREHLRQSFARYGVKPASDRNKIEAGIWCAPEQERKGRLDYGRIHFEAMQHDPDEVFRFIWENREQLGLCPDAYTEVQSVRPCVRVGEDGFVLRETVAEYVQILRLMPGELKVPSKKIPPAELLPRNQELFLYGGGTLIFDEWGRLRYHIHNLLLDKQGNLTKVQLERLRYLADSGYFLQRAERSVGVRASRLRRFGQMHFNRAINRPVRARDSWLGSGKEKAVHDGHDHAHHGGEAADHGEV
jgi:hypothetical protein